MNKLFPSMFSKPEPSQIISLIPCWVWVFVLVPMFMPFVAEGLWEQWASSVWFEIVYHAINGVVVLFLIGTYLKDEWYAVSADVGFYLKHVALAVGLILGTELLMLGLLYGLIGPYVWVILEAFPVVELAVVHTPASTLMYEPVVGTIVMTVFSPICMCGLFYCLCFSPICYRRPWLAYLSIPVITFLPALVDMLWRWESAGLTLGAYLAGLPVHLLACWIYQKTDNVWTPLATVAATNLLLSLVVSLLTFL